MTRDNQKQRVYNAEYAVEIYTVPMTFTATNRYIQNILESDWWISRYGDTTLKITRGRKNGRGGNGTVKLPKWARTPVTIMHEIAHNLVDFTQYAAHGPEFVRTVLDLIQEYEPDIYEKLYQSYLDHNVKIAQHQYKTQCAVYRPKPRRKRHYYAASTDSDIINASIEDIWLWDVHQFRTKAERDLFVTTTTKAIIITAQQAYSIDYRYRS